MYHAGDEVIVRGGFGKEPPYLVTLIGYGTKRGQVTYDYIDKEGNVRWCYDWQIKK
jgi:hypothetical protein